MMMAMCWKWGTNGRGVAVGVSVAVGTGLAVGGTGVEVGSKVAEGMGDGMIVGGAEVAQEASKIIRNIQNASRNIKSPYSRFFWCTTLPAPSLAQHPDEGGAGSFRDSRRGPTGCSANGGVSN
jgi:hypothetical protein